MAARTFAPKSNKRLGELLVESGVISAAQLADALAEQRRTGKRLALIFIERGLLAKGEAGRWLALQQGYEYVSLTAEPIDLPTARLLPEAFIRRLMALPIRREDDDLVVAMADPSDILAIDEISRTTGLRVRPVFTTETDLEWAIGQLFDVGGKVSQAAALQDAIEFADAGGAENVEGEVVVLDGEAAPPVIQMVDSILQGAINARATDIHLEPHAHQARVRYRIDGMLYDKAVIPRLMYAAVVSRIKILAALDIAEHARPQDGRITMRLRAREYDVRVGITPTAFGERVVLRLLDKSNVLVGLDRLGIPPEQELIIDTLVRRPHGMILVTGPTGSGKTTTLYSCLQRVNDPTRNIMTIEDPVEYYLEGISQIPVRPKAGLTFATGLRSMLRQDPNIIMVGEIRDAETAKIAVHAALTGHLVFSTLHTNDAAGAVVRLVDMGIEPYFITSSLIAAIGQRLMRRLCPACRQPYVPSPDLAAELGLPVDRRPTLYRAVGCHECDHTGYRGRLCVMEILRVNDAVRDLVLARRPATALREAAIAGGMTTIGAAATARVLDGTTSVDELRRVIYLEEA
ncbi:MAG: ATPase, T2SS/T4P/T4SS family [Armatimonadota bacterium]|nr:ATPase, T2SS/T4P/T4SS family [Armatimonadota bacterium]MDR7451952.1 ATPase, T2SS/T4P/T4SS family [Armatimonadota bacterium]MDR7466634.1 ATPase, T2SS/T4P/T4SS family [Armatimonadota bacterium]MDR7492892.1 ATPase, T2SS/T4P/T4SS family [Armatimonadota bacterium]MDR7498668.1 ATPase, T2SS/T4P/T4SS family [Armatimonadota bacterium]